MSRDERRAAIIAATLPLLRKHGQAVTTRQIAEACGIGEGTVFRVFTDKAELIDACLGAAFDQSPTLTQLAAIDRGLPLPARLEAAVDVLQRRLSSVIELLIALGFPQPPEPGERTSDGSAGPTRPQPSTGRRRRPAANPIPTGLRLSPEEVATMTRLFTFAASHPKINDDEPLSPRQITEILLYGVSKERTC